MNKLAILGLGASLAFFLLWRKERMAKQTFESLLAEANEATNQLADRLETIKRGYETRIADLVSQVEAGGETSAVEEAAKEGFSKVIATLRSFANTSETPVPEVPDVVVPPSDNPPAEETSVA